MALINYKFGLSDSALQFLETRIELEKTISIREYFGIVYGLDIDSSNCHENEFTLLEIRDFPKTDKLDTGELTIYEELSMLYGALIRTSENHVYLHSSGDDNKVLSFGVRILTNIRDLELARKDLYFGVYSGPQQTCLVNDARIKAKAANEVVNHYISGVLGYL